MLEIEIYEVGKSPVRIFMLQFKTYKVKLRKESYIRVNTRKLNKVPSTKCLLYIYWTNGPYYIKSSLL